MISAKVSFKEKNSPMMDRLMKELPKMKKAYVTIGVHSNAGTYDDGTEVFEVALWNEFGTKTIPPRSFVRSAVDEHTDQINQWREEALINIVEKGWTVKKALDKIGFNIQVLIQNKIKSNVPPEYGTGKKPNDAGTIAKLQQQKRNKGYPNRTLIASGLMLRSVTFKTVEG